MGLRLGGCHGPGWEAIMEVGTEAEGKGFAFSPGGTGLCKVRYPLAQRVKTKWSTREWQI